MHLRTVGSSVSSVAVEGFKPINMAIGRVRFSQALVNVYRQVRQGEKTADWIIPHPPV
jgi:hypothetical protein